MEGDASTGKWQELTPVLSSSCTVFPRSGFLTQAQQGDYAWALWRPYACCERRGQVFLGSVDFIEGTAMKRPELMNLSAKDAACCAPYWRRWPARSFWAAASRGRRPDSRPAAPSSATR
jgi:hypothetical protein